MAVIVFTMTTHWVLSTEFPNYNKAEVLPSELNFIQGHLQIKEVGLCWNLFVEFTTPVDETKVRKMFPKALEVEGLKSGLQYAFIRNLGIAKTAFELGTPTSPPKIHSDDDDLKTMLGYVTNNLDKYSEYSLAVLRAALDSMKQSNVPMKRSLSEELPAENINYDYNYSSQETIHPEGIKQEILSPLEAQQLQEPKNHGKRWTQPENTEFDQLLKQPTVGIEEIATYFGRSVGSIVTKAVNNLQSKIRGGMALDEAIEMYCGKVKKEDLDRIQAFIERMGSNKRKRFG